MSDFDNFMGAIKQQESGGDYNAGNPSGAVGAYQILGSNVGPWSQRYLGQTMTIDQFRSSPAAQDRLAGAVLKDYYDKYGAAGAASAWYSGNPNAYQSTAAQKGGPSIAGYVNQVLGRMGTAPAVDLSNQPADSPLNPWTQGNVGDATSSYGLDALGAVDGTNATTGAHSGLDAVDGTPLGAVAAPPPPSPTSSGGTSAGFTSGGGVPMPGELGGVRGAAVSLGQQYLGVPYVWGGTSPNGLDCSGLVQRVLGQVGIQAPRLSYDQLKMGPRVALGDAQPGDLIGWGDGHHVAMYIGNNQILEAPRTGLNVRIRNLGDSWDQSQGYYAVSLQNYYSK